MNETEMLARIQELESDLAHSRQMYEKCMENCRTRTIRMKELQDEVEYLRANR